MVAPWSGRIRFSLYIEDMFSTGHDVANRATVKLYAPDAMNVVGLALREDKKIVDKITKGRADTTLEHAAERSAASCLVTPKRESHLLSKLCWFTASAGMTGYGCDAALPRVSARQS